MSTKHKLYARRRVQFSCGDELITKQSAAAECDINNILAQYKRTGIINHIAQSTARYEDLPPALDYQEALNTVMEAERAFSQLPSKIRDRYRNNPAELLAAIHDPRNEKELRELGILKQPPTVPGPAPAPSPVPPKGD